MLNLNPKGWKAERPILQREGRKYVEEQKQLQDKAEAEEAAKKELERKGSLQRSSHGKKRKNKTQPYFSTVANLESRFPRLDLYVSFNQSSSLLAWSLETFLLGFQWPVLSGFLA